MIDYYNWRDNKKILHFRCFIHVTSDNIIRGDPTNIVVGPLGTSPSAIS